MSNRAKRESRINMRPAQPDTTGGFAAEMMRLTPLIAKDGGEFRFT